MKKILFVIRSLEYGGAEKSLVNLLHQLPRERYQVDVLLFKKKGGFLCQLPQWVRLLDTPQALAGLFSPLGKSGRYFPTKLLGTACARVVRKTRKQRMAFRWKHFYKKAIAQLPGCYDVAVAYVGTEVLYYVADRVQADRKYVWIHNDYRTAAYSRDDDHPYFARMDGIVSVSEDCVKTLRQEFPEYSHKLHCIENITSAQMLSALSDAFVPEEYRSACNILSVGRLSVQKGFDMAIEAAALLKSRAVSFCWYVIGDGDQREILQEMIRRYGVEDCFFLLGTRSNPYPYMKHCTFLAQPSRFEGKSVVLDEAKILGVPILATAYPTVGDQIVQGQQGHIVEMNPSAIAEGVQELLKSKTLLQQIRSCLAEGDFSNQAEIEKYMKLLDE